MLNIFVSLEKRRSKEITINCRVLSFHVITFRTISNVPSSKTAQENNNVDNILKELGFNTRGKAPVTGIPNCFLFS